MTKEMHPKVLACAEWRDAKSSSRASEDFANFIRCYSANEKQGRVPWHIVDASKTIEEVQKDIWGIVENTIERVEGSRDVDADGEEVSAKYCPLNRMWEEGEYKLPSAGEEKCGV